MAGSVLETFIYMFAADTQALDDGLKKSDDSTDKLKKGLIDTDEAASKLGDNFMAIAKNAVTLFAGVFAIGAIKAFTVESANATNELGKQAKAAFMSAEAFDTYGKAAVAAGGSGEALTGFLSKMKLAGRDPIKVLDDLAGRFKGLSDIRANRLAEALGIDKGMIPLLQKGKQGIEDMIARQKELGIVTTEQVEVAKKYKDQQRDTTQVYDDIKRKIATEILPYMTQFMKIMERIAIWARDNKFFVIGFFGAVAAVITVLYLPALVRAIAATYALLAPYIAIVAAVAAVGAIVALVFDDIMNYLDGNNSMIGQIAKKWPIVGEAVHAVADVVKLWWGIMKAILGALSELIMNGPSAAFQYLKEQVGAVFSEFMSKHPALMGALQAIGAAFTSAANIATSAWEGLVAIVKAVIGTVSGAISTIMKGANAVAGVFGFGDGKKIQQTADAGQAALATASRAPTNNVSSSAISNFKNMQANKTVQVNGPITVQTQATDAEGVAKGVSQGLSMQLKNAQDNFDDGVAA